jgi:hypothetical protein
MYFRDLLIILTNLFSDSEFDTRTVSSAIGRYIQESGYSPQLLTKFTTKRISNDLDRLCNMGFLGAKPVKRQISTEQGKRNRGWKYLYHITKQGKQYYDYLLNPEEATQRNKIKIYQKQRAKQDLLGILPTQFPPQLADVDVLFREIQARSTKAGRFNRFPDINGNAIVMRYINAKQMLYSVMDAKDRPMLFQLDGVSGRWTRALSEPLEDQKKTMLQPDGKYRYLYGILSRRNNYHF